MAPCRTTRATAESHAVIQGNGLLLIDSGGQYLGGTTDITRVWPIGTVSEAMKRDYTLVLQGTLALSRTRFPRGTLSPMLDAIARAPLWAHALDYGHGTGHGVGYFLNVHEGPQSISKAVPDANMAMELGMITSIEPGLYRPGQWGIRIENLVLNVPAQLPGANGEFGEFLEFETLTLCPIDTRCIARELLRQDEIDWLKRLPRDRARAAFAARRWRRTRLAAGAHRAALSASAAPQAPLRSNFAVSTWASDSAHSCRCERASRLRPGRRAAVSMRACSAMTWLRSRPRASARLALARAQQHARRAG